MAVYEISSFRGGLSDYEDKGIPGAFKFGKNLDVRKMVDSLSCQQALKEEGSGIIVDLIHFFVKCSDGNTYGFGNAGKVYKRTSSGTWSVVYPDPDGWITGATEWPSETGKTYLYWATYTKLHRKEIPGESNWSDVDADAGWPKENLTSTMWHTMREAGGALVIANGSFLAMVGYDESYTNEALDLIPGNIAKTIVERSGRTIVGSERITNINKGVNATIDSEVPLAQIGDDGELFYANMIDSIPLKRFPGGGRVNPGGVTNEIEQANLFEWEQTALSWISKQSVGNMALFAIFGADSGKGGIYSYGRKNKNHPFVLNLDYQLDADYLGAIVSVNGTILVSYKSDSNYGVKKVDSTAKATGVYEGLDLKVPAKMVKKPVEIIPWNYVGIFCAPLVSGTSLEFWYKLNKTGNFIQAKMESGATQFTATGEKKAVFLIGEEAEIFEPRLVLNPTGNYSPEVYKIKIYLGAD